jgi:hypothetical protein
MDVRLQIASDNDLEQVVAFLRAYHAPAGFRSRERFFLMSSETPGESRLDHRASVNATSAQKSNE